MGTFLACLLRLSPIEISLVEKTAKPAASPFGASGRPAVSIMNEEVFMRERGLTIPEIMLIGGTRVALGAGIGLLVGNKLSNDGRKGAGWALLAVGVLTTIPIVINVLTKPRFDGKLAA